MAKRKGFNVDNLLKSLFDENIKETLRDLFNKRVIELKMSATNVAEVIGVSPRALKGIVDGTQKMVDFTNLVKLSSFLQVSKEEVIELYIESLEKNFPEEEPISPEIIEFIKEKFDLVSLRKAKLISSVTNFREIEEKLKALFGLKRILDYKKPKIDVAFSAGITQPKNELTRTNWIGSATTIFEEIDNSNEYNREALIKYFPQIRWHSTNVEKGLIEVIRDLYKLGVTVIYQAPLQGLHLHGATFSVYDKPCIVLTNYKGFYPTLWFALIHELFHVLFDWEEISNSRYHISDDDTDILSVKEKEDEANKFAREYLFSKEKTDKVKSQLKNEIFVEEYAKLNQVHSSFIYVFYARDEKVGNGMAWAKARHKNPTFQFLIDSLGNPWENRKPTSEYVKHLKANIYKQ